MKKRQAPPTGALFAQIADNWNGQVTKLFNWSINRLQTTAVESDVKATQTDCKPPSFKPGGYMCSANGIIPNAVNLEELPVSQVS
jgi:hypothetical protein